MYDWLEWVNESENKGILHKMNNKTEVRIGPFFVDGYDPDSQECFEFFGCYYHGHNCTEWKDKKKQKERYESTLERLSYLEKAGYSVYYIWQCEFDRQIGENDDLAQFVKNRRPIFSQKYPGMSTMSTPLLQTSSLAFWKWIFKFLTNGMTLNTNQKLIYVLETFMTSLPKFLLPAISLLKV